MKKFLLTLSSLLCICLPFASACASNKVLAKPDDTSLEFWVTQKVSTYAFIGHYSLNDVFGGFIYLGEGYQPNVVTEDNYIEVPEHCVTYTVTAYPDYSSNNGKFDTVTRIEITDPDVNIYGISCNSTLEDFDKAFMDSGCKIQNKGIIHIASYGKTQIAFADYEGNETITIWVEVTNKKGIIF